uniref:Uncharacterized protein n=1 Tax=Panagrolaimus sp. JU765 TaxID=591449 RepID=A0AC34RKB1_9BILA
MEFDLHNHRGNNFIRSSSLNMPHNYSSGDTMIASPLSHHWNPQPLRSSNVPSNSNNNGQRKRDFHFQ